MLKFSSLLGALTQLFFHQFPKTFLLQFVFWVIAATVDMYHLIDVCWCFQHFFTGLAVVTNNFKDASPLNQFKNMVYLSVLALWTARLGGFLIMTRILKEYKEARYEDLANNFKGKFMKTLFMFGQFHGQAFLMLATTLPLYFLFRQESKSFALNNILGIMIALVGIFGEAKADQDLYNFKSTNKEKGKVFRGGFFRTARHPNLFFEIVTWVGFAVAALDMNNLAGTGWAFVGPISLWAIMYFITIPITTRHMKSSRPNYDKILKETNMFIPTSM